MAYLKSSEVLISLLIIIASTLIGFFISTIMVDENKKNNDFYFYSTSKIYIDPDSSQTFNRDYLINTLEKNMSLNYIVFDNETLVIKLEGSSEKEIKSKIAEVSKIIDKINKKLIQKIKSKYEYIQSTYQKYLTSVEEIIKAQKDMLSSYNNEDLGIVEKMQIYEKQYEYFFQMNDVLFQYLLCP